jgi:type II secretion system protein G
MQWKLFQSRHGKGFTLIELLIVIAIILILIAIALPNFLAAQIRSKVARAKSDLRTYATAEESYRLDFGMYTDDSSEGNLQLTTPVPYIKEVPLDPFGTSYTKSGNEQTISGLTNSFYKIGTGSVDKCDANEVLNAACNRIQPLTGAQDPWDWGVKRDIFVVASWGPDQADPFGEIGSFPYPRGGGGGWIAYNPSNGTRSHGGMFRVGGARLMPSYHHMYESQ